MTDAVCPGGIAAANRVTLRFRTGLLGTVAAGALSLAFGGPALATLPAGCTLDATFTIETCTGDQSAGVGAGGLVTTLNVNNLTTAIAPAGGTPGIMFTSAGDITINSNTGALGITTSNADGIYANSSGNVAVNSTGNITTAVAGRGIYAIASIAVTVTSTGNLATAGIGIDAIGAGNGGASTIVTSIGNISTAGSHSYGIKASAVSGAVTVTNPCAVITTCP